jgi:hypothetical protein
MIERVTVKPADGGAIEIEIVGELANRVESALSEEGGGNAKTAGCGAPFGQGGCGGAQPPTVNSKLPDLTVPGARILRELTLKCPI